MRDIHKALKGSRDEPGVVDRYISTLAEPEAARCRDAVLRILAAFERRLDREKFERGRYEFLDLETRALDLLENNGQVRECIRARYRAVLVDEYQDVNRLQQKNDRYPGGPVRLVVPRRRRQAIHLRLPPRGRERLLLLYRKRSRGILVHVDDELPHARRSDRSGQYDFCPRV
ncbi:MAG: UvrD-helicase domain-containing protein [Deltaproteobacteria bacterium]|nr:UvrD-helicase domain-containing protein [Deltaproteobacteria bacterium]